MKRFVLIGLGTFGAATAKALHDLGHETCALDLDQERVDAAVEWVTYGAVGDGSSLETLERIGADDADAAVVSTGDDIAASVLAVLALRDVGVDPIYAKAVSTSHERVLRKLGVQEVVQPEKEAAQRMAKQMASRTVLNYVQLGPGLYVQEMAVPAAWEGKTLRELSLPTRHRISVVGVHDVLRQQYLPVPDPDEILDQSSSLLIAGEKKTLEALEELG